MCVCVCVCVNVTVEIQIHEHSVYTAHLNEESMISVVCTMPYPLYNKNISHASTRRTKEKGKKKKEVRVHKYISLQTNI